MTNVLAELGHWAKTLLYWEQAALDKIVYGASFDDSDYDKLLQYLLEDANLLTPSTKPRSVLQFPKDSSANDRPTVPVLLAKISNLQNVNALVSGQVLTFGPAMTAIYGGNGSGKSGYARVFGCAGFTRGDREVLPDVTCPVDETVVLSADIEIQESASSRVIHYRIGERCPELSSFYVFDSTSVHVHLTKSNLLSFSPAGLSYLKRLVEVTDEVRKRLKAKIEECEQPHVFSNLFQGDSEVSRLIAHLGSQTDLETLHKLATVSRGEEEQIEQLDKEIARLKAQDVFQQVNSLKQTIDDLGNLADSLRNAEANLSDGVVEGVLAALKSYSEQRSVAQRIGVDQFKSELFTQTGRDVWYKFIEAAKDLADAEQMSDKPYPQPGSHCLLCRQPLSAEALDLLMRLWTFLEGEAQAKLEEAQNYLDSKGQVTDAVDLSFFDENTVSYRYLQEHNPDLLGEIETFILVCSKRRESVRRIVDNPAQRVEIPPPLSASGVLEVEQMVASLKTQLSELESRNPATEIARLEPRMLDLRHRVLLGEHLTEIQEYVQKRKWAQRAAKEGGSTRHITQKHNSLFNELVTDRYVELFEKILRDLGRPLRVKVATRGRKGEAYKRVVIESDLSASVEVATPDKILSEGEKRVVALADFLTEVALDTTSCGIILDDPVTSLDLEWREQIASILAAEAERRQVIVFTHDLPFLYHLKKHSEQNRVKIRTHWIKQGINGKPGYVFLDNSPALEREYRKSKQARSIYERAKKAPAEEQAALLRDGFGALRTSYEAFIIFELFNEVVMRFDERISFGRLKGVAWDKSIVDEVISKCELLSRYIEGHLHSDAFSAKKPDPRDLLNEIENFERLRKRLNDLKERSR